MLHKESKAVPIGKGSTPQEAGQMVTWEELRQAVSGTWGETFR